MEITFEEIKAIGSWANVLLVPALWILYKIGRKIDTIVSTLLVHEKEDALVHADFERRITENYERTRDLEQLAK
jgi:hypothetical protein